MVPKMGSMGVKFGMESPKNWVNWLTPNPKLSNNITVGIFVLEAETSKTKANINKEQSVIINCVVMVSILKA
jgi:hypothetical protein